MTKIMLVEDDKSLREIYGVRLLAEGYDIVSAGDGELALAMAIKERPDLIIADIMMPKISGFDMLDILRSTTETKNIKVIMMTALSSEEQRARGEQLGADRYLVKSQVGIEDVVRVVHEVLGDAPGGQKTPGALQPQARPAAQSSQQPQQPVTPAPASAQTAPQSPPESSIPQPTAPFSSPRPASLGERVIQPLKDNPRTQRPDINQLLDKEMAKEVGATTQPTAPTPPATSTPQPQGQPSEPAQPVTPATLASPPTTPQNEVDATAQFQQQPQQAPPAPQPAPPQDQQVVAPQDINDQLDQLIANEAPARNTPTPQPTEQTPTPTSLPPVQPQPQPQPAAPQPQQPVGHPDQLQVPQRPR